MSQSTSIPRAALDAYAAKRGPFAALLIEDMIESGDVEPIEESEEKT